MVSIIVPIYNAEKYLRECLESVASQIFTDIEVVMIDDGSTDNSKQICDEFSKNDSRFKLITIPNSGVCRARNIGLQRARGEYIAFLDSDDKYDPDFLSSLYSKLIENCADIAFCDFYNESGKESPDWQDCVIEKSELFDKYIAGYFKNRIMNKLYKREVVNVLFPEDRPIMEDAYWTGNVLLKCNRAVCISEAKYYYRVLSSSLSHKKSSQINQTGSFANQLDLFNILVANSSPCSVIDTLWPKASQRIEYMILSANDLSVFNVYEKMRQFIEKMNRIYPELGQNKLYLCIHNNENYEKAQKEYYHYFVFHSSGAIKYKLIAIYKRIRELFNNFIK